MTNIHYMEQLQLVATLQLVLVCTKHSRLHILKRLMRQFCFSWEIAFNIECNFKGCGDKTIQEK